MQGKLYVLRKEKKITQEDMAKYLDINVHTYRNKELGHTVFNADEMFKISTLFSVSMEHIFLPSYGPKWNKTKSSERRNKQ